jgi:hypothetical protein
MRVCKCGARLLASAALLCAWTGGASAADQQTSALGLPTYEGKTTVGTGAIAIEGTMLASTAFDAAAVEIAKNVNPSVQDRSVVVLGNSDTIDFGSVAMFQTEMIAIAKQLQAARDTPASSKGRPQIQMAIPAIVPIITSLAGLFRSDTDISAVDVNLDARVLTAAVASHVTHAFIPSARIGAEVSSPLKDQFDALGVLAQLARSERDALAQTEPKGQAKTKLDRLDAALKRYDTFAEQATTADKGVVPLVVASRLSAILATNPLVLRVNAEKSGGTLLKRTNILTFFGADGVSISSGLVASYQMTEPSSGQIAAAGVVTCRTGISKLRAVQDDSWKPIPRPGEITSDPPVAICRAITSQVPSG